MPEIELEDDSQLTEQELMQKRKREAQREFERKRKEAIKNMIKNQTNYDDDEIESKLLLWNGNYLNVIKEYLDPNFQKKKKPVAKKSVNQMMMGEIRNFMDDVSIKYERRKKENERKQEYINKLVEEYKRRQDLSQNVVVSDKSDDINTNKEELPKEKND